MTNPAILTQQALNALREMRAAFAPAAMAGRPDARHVLNVLDTVTQKIDAADTSRAEHLERARGYLINIRTAATYSKPGDIADLAEAALRELDAAQGRAVRR